MISGKMRVFGLALIAACVLAGNAFAKEGPDFIGDNKAAVEQNMQIVRSQITKLHLKDGSPMPAETPAELKQPIIPFEEGKRVTNRGVLSAMAQYCGLDWQKDSYNPFMTEERDSKKWSDKQIAFIGGLHGLIQGSTVETFKTKGACTDSLRSKTRGILDALKAQ